MGRKQKELERVKSEEWRINENNEKLAQKIERLEKAMEKKKRMTDESYLVREVYDHMLDIKKVTSTSNNPINFI